MTFETILFEEADGIATITLNRPDTLNAMSAQMLRELNTALDRLRDKRSSRVLILTGAGRGFSGGVDLSGAEVMTEDGVTDLGFILDELVNPLAQRFAALPIPIVTAVNGAAAGAACSMALMGDIVIAARSAYFLLAFVNIGLVPDMGATWILPHLVGKARAQAMMMLGERIKAEQAEGWGMIYRAVDDAALMTEARAMAARLAKGPTESYRLIRQGLRHCLEQGFSEALWMERTNQRIAGMTEDSAEGIGAFLQKRPAQFKGR